MPRYEVKAPGRSGFHVEAKNSDEAKRLYCQLFDRKPSDPWLGISALTARKIEDPRSGSSSE